MCTTPELCRKFWIDRIGMVEKRRTDAGGFAIVQVGFADQSFAFELVPLELMKDNPDNLDLATPSIAFQVDDLGAAHADLVGRGSRRPTSAITAVRRASHSLTRRDIGSP
jgi:hypothetical protein